MATIFAPSTRWRSSPAAAPPTCRPTATRSSPSSTAPANRSAARRSEDHTSELQSRLHLVCRLLLEKIMSVRSFPADSIVLFDTPRSAKLAYGGLIVKRLVEHVRIIALCIALLSA